MNAIEERGRHRRRGRFKSFLVRLARSDRRSADTEPDVNRRAGNAEDASDIIPFEPRF